MAVDAAYVAELRGWLQKVQASLQVSMEEVTRKLEETREPTLCPKDLDLQQRQEYLRSCQEQRLRSTSSSMGSHSPESLQATTEEAKWKSEETQSPVSPFDADIQRRQEHLKSCQENALRSTSSSMGALSPEPPPVDEVLVPINSLPGMPDLKAEVKPGFQGLPETPKESKKHETLKPGAKIAADASGLLVTTDSSKSAMTPPIAEKKEGWFKRCLARCFCRKRFQNMVSKKGPRPLKPACPTLFLTVTKEQNNEESLGKKLKSMRKLKAIPVKFWEPRVLIEDANGLSYSLKAIEDAKDKHKDMAFPVKCSWKWLPPAELPSTGKVGKMPQALWWKMMGLRDNGALRALSMKLHARMHHCNQQVVLLTQGVIKDAENALATDTTFEANTMAWEMEMAHDVLRDIDTLLVLTFGCGAGDFSIGQLAQAAGCPWAVFLESYMGGRNNALSCDPTTGGKRRELILAAAKGIDGLEQLYQHLVHKIDANDLLFFKVMLLGLNGVTAAAQFTWSDYMVPAINPATTTPTPSFVSQVAAVYSNITGGQ